MPDPKKPPSPEDLVRALFGVLTAGKQESPRVAALRKRIAERAARARRAGPAAPVRNPIVELPQPERSVMLPKIIVALVLSVVVYVLDATRPFAVPFLILALAVVFIIEGVRIIPQQEAWVVERLGRFHEVLEPGLRIIIPIVDRVAYKHSLKEVPFDVPEQVCITKDNTQLAVDGIVYYQVTDPRLASYGTSDYLMAITQLAQTTLRSEVGKMELDKTFESRDEINRQIVSVLDDAGRSWGVKVLRYEVKNLTPPEAILRAMQQQITAEREKRAVIAKSEGQRQEEINIADGAKQAAILTSEGEKAALINKAQGEATAIRVVAEANAAAIRAVAEALAGAGGMDAANLKVAEEYITAFGNLAKAGNTLILPSNLSDVAGLIGTAMTVLDRTKGGATAVAASPRGA